MIQHSTTEELPYKRVHKVGSSMVVTIAPIHVSRLRLDENTFFLQTPVQNGILLKRKIFIDPPEEEERKNNTIRDLAESSIEFLLVTFLDNIDIVTSFIKDYRRIIEVKNDPKFNPDLKVFMIECIWTDLLSKVIEFGNELFLNNFKFSVAMEIQNEGN